MAPGPVLDGDAPVDLMVLIPCHNEEETLSEQLEALVSQRWAGRWGIAVVDNRSTDGTAAVAASYADRGVRYVRATGRSGVAYARNEGVRGTRSVSVAFCDGDDVVSPGWVEAMGSSLAEHAYVTGVLDAVALNGEEAARLRPGSSHRSLPHFGPIPFGRGNNSGMHRRLWEDLGGYDEDFVGLEDIELALRAAAMGVSPVLVEAAEVRYRFRTDRRAIWRQAHFYGRGRPSLAAKARALGMEAPSRLEGLRSWAWLALHLPEARSAEGRARLLWVLGNRLGVLRGAFETRTFHV